jgi:predicted DNA-binding transcriptional regulator YafY
MPEQKKWESMLNILEILYRKRTKSFTAREILEQLDWPDNQLRSLQRDLDELSTSGEIEKMPAHRIMLYKAYRKPPAFLGNWNIHDIFSFLLSEETQHRIFPNGGHGLRVFSDILSSETSKTSTTRRLYQEQKSRLPGLVYFAGEKITGPDPAILPCIYEGLLFSQKIEADYCNNENTVRRRKLEPWQLVSWDQEWYLLSPSENGHKEELKLFKLTRLSNVKLLRNSSFKRNHKLLANAHQELQNAPDLFVAHSEAKSMNITLEFRSFMFNTLKERRIHASQQLPNSPPSEGLLWFPVHYQMPLSEGLVRWIIKWGNSVRVRSPIRLQKAVKKRILEVLEFYPD